MDFTTSFHYAEIWRNIANTDARFQDLHETWISYDEILSTAYIFQWITANFEFHNIFLKCNSFRFAMSSWNQLDFVIFSDIFALDWTEFSIKKHYLLNTKDIVLLCWLILGNSLQSNTFFGEIHCRITFSVSTIWIISGLIQWNFTWRTQTLSHSYYISIYHSSSSFIPLMFSLMTKCSGKSNSNSIISVSFMMHCKSSLFNLFISFI